MRNILFFSIFQLFAVATSAQEKTVEAFSQSYAQEQAMAYGRAIAALDVVYDADSYPLNLRLGWLHYLNGDYKKSKTFYENAVRLQPGSVEARLGYALPLAAGNEWEAVVKVYKKILDLDPSNSVVLYRMALIHYNVKGFETAAGYARKLSVLYPFGFDGQLILAKIEIGLGNIIEARKALLVCLQYQPGAKDVLELWEKVR